MSDHQEFSEWAFGKENLARFENGLCERDYLRFSWNWRHGDKLFIEQDANIGDSEKKMYEIFLEYKKKVKNG